MPEYTVSLDPGKALTAAEQLAIQTQQAAQRALYPGYYSMQDKITALVTEIKKYNATAPAGKKINTVMLNMDDNTMTQKES